MTVGELIEKLSKVPADLSVFTEDERGDIHDTTAYLQSYGRTRFCVITHWKQLLQEGDETL